MHSVSRGGARRRAAVLLGLATLALSAPGPARAQGGSGSSTATGISRLLNPAISANGLFLGSYLDTDPSSGRGGEPALSSGFGVQELELQLSASIDPHTKADLIFSVPGGESFELEEGIITLTSLPADFGGRFGKFFARFGKHNTFHTHQFPFIEPPLVSFTFFGEEGLADVGVEANYLVPVSWYTELGLEVYDGDAPEAFGGTGKKDLVYVAHLGQLWDLGDASTLELGLSGAGGNNPTGHLTSFGGVDLTYKWVALSRSYKQVIWQSELIRRNVDTGSESPDRTGLYTALLYRFARTWWIQGRYDWLEAGLDYEDLYGGGPAVASSTQDLWRVSALVAYVPSEFSALRLQVSAIEIEDDLEWEAFLQFNFTIGSHPAHRY